MVVKTETNKKVEVVSQILCDKCGKDTGEWFNAAKLSFHGGWDSSHDMEQWELDLCEECWWVVFKFVTGRSPNTNDVYCFNQMLY